MNETKRVPWFKQRKWRIALLVVMALLVVWGGLRWDRQRRALYRVTILPSLGGKVTVAHATNDRGQVVGTSHTTKGQPRLFLWERGKGIRDLGSVCEGRIDINNDGWIAGTMLDASANKQAFVRDPNGTRMMLDTLGGPTSSARKLNDKNQVVGVSETTSGASHAFLWDAAAGMVDLGTLGGASSWAKTINNAGRVFGYADTAVVEVQPFLWDPNDGMVALPIQHAADLNSKSHVIGEVHVKGRGYYAATWRKDTGLVRLFPFDRELLDAAMINDSGQVLYDEFCEGLWERFRSRLPLLGRSADPRQWYLWDPQRGRVSIEQWVPTRLGEEFYPLGLNNKGCIVGLLTSKDQTRVRAVLLEPIAEKWER